MVIENLLTSSEFGEMMSYISVYQTFTNSIKPYFLLESTFNICICKLSVSNSKVLQIMFIFWCSQLRLLAIRTVLDLI